MALFNYASKEITIKIVYYGPGLSGKTTNLQFIYAKTSPDAKGKMIGSLLVGLETNDSLCSLLEQISVFGLPLEIRWAGAPARTGRSNHKPAKPAKPARGKTADPS